MKVQKAILTLTSLSLTLASCGMSTLQTLSATQTTQGTPLKMSKFNVNANPLNKTVCDPFEGNPAQSLSQGIRASLYVRNSTMPEFGTSSDYVDFAAKSDQKLFFADLNVPTRMFTEGFSTEANNYLKSDSGEKLIEYFGMKFESIVRLGANDDEGTYEFAVLSDDGATLKIVGGTAENPTLTTVVDNEGDHPTRMGCATQTVAMKKDTSLPIQLTYYQGPRYHISNILLWRKASKAGKDSSCGDTGNNTFFDPDNNSVPQDDYNGLLARGWKVVGKENYFLPSEETYNPCVVGTAPVITAFQINEVLLTGANLTWTTDIPATSQLKITNKATGEVIVTDSDLGLRTAHNIQVSGLERGTTYTAQAVSISEDLGKTISDEIEFTTQ